MNWHELLFMHWRVPVEPLRKLIPKCLDVDTFGEDAWIGVVPFRMSGVSHRLLPNLPGVSAFPELNVRTYVRDNGKKPGVWFFSLDATSWLAVRMARKLFHLPYMDAKINCTREGDEINYSSERTHKGKRHVKLDVTYEPIGDPYTTKPDTLEHFLTARYCLYCRNGSKVYRGEILHPAWKLQDAKCEIRKNTMTESVVPLPDEAPLLHYAERTEVVAWSNERIN